MHTSGVDLRTPGAWWSGTATAHEVRVCGDNFLRVGLRICRFRIAMAVAAGLAMWDQWLGTCSSTLHYHIIYDVKSKLKHEEDRIWGLWGLNLFTSHANFCIQSPSNNMTRLKDKADESSYYHTIYSCEAIHTDKFCEILPTTPVLDINILHSKADIMYAETTCTILF